MAKAEVMVTNPTWNDLREGDLVTFERGNAGNGGHVARTEIALMWERTIFVGTFLPSKWEKRGYRVTKIVRWA